MSAVTITTTANSIEITVPRNSPAIPKMQAYVKEHFFEYRFGREEIILYPDPKSDAVGNQKRKRLLQWFLDSSRLKEDRVGSMQLLMRYKRELRIRLVTDRPGHFSTATIHIRRPERAQLVISVDNDPKGLVSHYISSVLKNVLLSYDRQDRILYIDCRADVIAEPLGRLLEKKTIAGSKVSFRYVKAVIDEITASATPRTESREIFQGSAYAHIVKLRHSYRLLEVEHNSNDLEAIKRQFRKLASTYHPDKADQSNEALVKHYSRKFQEISEAYEFLKKNLQRG